MIFCELPRPRSPVRYPQRHRAIEGLGWLVDGPAFELRIPCLESGIVATALFHMSTHSVFYTLHAVRRSVVVIKLISVTRIQQVHSVGTATDRVVRSRQVPTPHPRSPPRSRILSSIHPFPAVFISPHRPSYPLPPPPPPPLPPPLSIAPTRKPAIMASPVL